MKKENAAGKEILFETKGISKVFPGVIALNKVDLSIKKGEIHAIVGENGAGKSTLCKIIMGIHEPEEGSLFWEGEKVVINSPHDALNLGIQIVYQERSLVSFLTGAQNIFLGDEEVKNGLIDEKNILDKAKDIRKIFHTKTPINIPVNQLSPSQRQMIEIMRALRHQPKMLILDEPTSSLTEKDCEALFNVLENIKKRGVAVIFISHKLKEVFRIADRISIFRNGKKIHTESVNTITEEKCIEYMVNRSIGNLFPEVVNTCKDIIVLKVDHLSDQNAVKDVSFSVKKGEVVGFYGLIGSGRTEAVEMVYGLKPKIKGEIYFKGENISGKLTPAKMMAKGLYLIPEDRKEHGVFYGLKIRENISIAYLKTLLVGLMPGLINKKKEKILAKDLLESKSLKVNYTDMEKLIDILSGGNQQKVIIARWINQQNAEVVIVDEPTIGIDVETKYEIYVLLRNLAKKGISVIFISSEMPELLGVCDRLYIFKEGKISKEMGRDLFDADTILSYAL